MRRRITGLTTMSMVGIGDTTTIETGTIAFIDAGIMMETVAGAVDNDAGLRIRRHYSQGETIVAFPAGKDMDVVGQGSCIHGLDVKG
jgi:hypothetical protein